MKTSHRVSHSVRLIHRTGKDGDSWHGQEAMLTNQVLLFSAFEDLHGISQRHKNISTPRDHFCLQEATFRFLVWIQVGKNYIYGHLKYLINITSNERTSETYLSIATQVEKEVIWFSSFHIKGQSVVICRWNLGLVGTNAISVCWHRNFNLWGKEEMESKQASVYTAYISEICT